MQKENLLDYDSKPIQYLCKKDKRLKKVISLLGPLSYTIHEDPYVFLIHEIIEQMLSVKAANKIFDRLVQLCAGEVSPQTISLLTDEQLKSIGTSNAKVQYIRNITEATVSHKVDFLKFNDMSDKEIIGILTSVKGIGMWTAKMYLIFVLDRYDVLPLEDVAFLRSYMWMYKTDDTSRKSVEKKCYKWKPYSSIAARYLYRALNSGLTKEEFHLFK